MIRLSLHNGIISKVFIARFLRGPRRPSPTFTSTVTETAGRCRVAARQSRRAGLTYMADSDPGHWQAAGAAGPQRLRLGVPGRASDSPATVTGPE